MTKTLLAILLLIISTLSATIVTVDIDGNGQYMAIQDGITAAVNGDTVLVYPGVYVENVDYAGKSITLASLKLTTGNPAYRDSTIIDGNQTGSCVKAMNAAITCTIYGFTIRNGSGTPYGDFILGGGIFAYNITHITVSHCRITANTAYWGGGICNYWGSILLRETDIYYNQANTGGGIHCSAPSTISFDSEQRCSVYENYSDVGSDISAINTSSVINVYLDMATLSYPDEYYQMYLRSSPSGVGSFTFDILQGYREEVNHDLYVSPDGDDANTGFTPDEPLKTIAWALHKIAPDSLNPKTVYVLPGTYSTDEGQIFPLYLKNHTRLIGNDVSRPHLINNMYNYVISSFRKQNVVVSNFQVSCPVTSLGGVFNLQRTNGVEFSNIEVVNALPQYTGPYEGTDNLVMRNVSINNVIAYRDPGFLGQLTRAVIEDCKFNNCHSTNSSPIGGGWILEASVHDSLYLSNVSIMNCTIAGQTHIMQIDNWEYQSPQITINNLLIANCSTNFVVTALFKNENVFSTLSNCTFANNSATGHAVELVGKWNVSNCIFDNVNATEIYVPNTTTYSTQINFRNNLIEGYPGSVYSPNPANVNYIQGNFTADPGFVGTDWTNPLSYRLGYDSPCIDAGTPDTTGLYLPEFDLIGNSRIFNDVVDIGCYEWNGTENQDDIIPEISELIVSTYPNPFRQFAHISYRLAEPGKVRLEIYNLKGQRVKSLVDEVKQSGDHTYVWDGRDENGKEVSAGIYFCKLVTSGRVVTSKLMLLK